MRHPFLVELSVLKALDAIVVKPEWRSKAQLMIVRLFYLQGLLKSANSSRHDYDAAVICSVRYWYKMRIFGCCYMQNWRDLNRT